MSNTQEKRLIDVNVLNDVIEHIDWYHISLQGTLEKGANSELHTPLYKADDIYKALEEAPTVDAMEVVHGRWEKAEYYGYMRCDKCKDVYIEECYLGNGKWNYCPNCGAKMDGGNEDG